MSVHFSEGLAKHGPELGVKSGPSWITEAHDDLMSRNSAYQAVMGERTTVLSPAQATADNATREFLKAATKSFRVDLGERWNQSWAETGMLGSTAIPSKQTEREALLNTLADYLTKHPQFENAKMSVTASRAKELYQAMILARTNLNTNKADQKTARQARDKAANVLRKRLRAVISDLDTALEPSSPLWKAFGLNEPVRRSKSDVAKAADKAAVKAEKNAQREAAKAKRAAEKAEEKAAEAAEKAMKARQTIQGLGTRAGADSAKAGVTESDVALEG